jgi:hypothetical protein
MEDQEEDLEQHQEMFNQVDQVIHHRQVLHKVIQEEQIHMQDHFQEAEEVELQQQVEQHQLHQDKLPEQVEQVQQIQYQDLQYLMQVVEVEEDPLLLNHKVEQVVEEQDNIQEDVLLQEQLIQVEQEEQVLTVEVVKQEDQVLLLLRAPGSAGPCISVSPGTNTKTTLPAPAGGCTVATFTVSGDLTIS